MMKLFNSTCLQAIACLVLIAGFAGNATASTAEAGQELARQCTVCHGSNGIANDPLSPNLAGQSAAYLEKSLKDFRAGARQDPRMSYVAQGLEDDDIKALAAWYASFVVDVTVPE